MGNLIDIKKPQGFRIKAKSDKKAEITIYDEIGSGYWFDAVSAKQFTQELNALPDSITEIDLRVNSPGGDVFEGFTIYNRLKQHKAKVTTYVDGLAASIASVIALAGDEIVMSEGSFIMIHKAWAMTAGNSDDLEQMVDRLLDIDEQLLGIYQRKTKLDRVELRSMITAETWLNADEAIEMGFATRKSEDEAVMAASAEKATWFKNKPNINRDKIVKSKINEFKNDIERYLARK